MLIINSKRNLNKRFLATLIDYGLYTLLMYTYIMFFGQPIDNGGHEVSGILILPMIITWFFYFVFLEGFFSNSATLGHQLFYLKVVQLNGREISVEHSLKRHLLDPFDLFLFGLPAIIAIQSSKRNQRIGDMWAGTTVLLETEKKNAEIELDPMEKP